MVFEKLPSSVLPVNYNIWIQPDLHTLTFDGHEEIELIVKEEVTDIILNARDISIQEAAIIGEGAENVDVSVVYKAHEEKVVFGLKQEIKPGKYILKLGFAGILNDELRGFYRTRYMTSSQEQRYGAMTHFEATGARRAFPCFDEPALRATFDITLVVPKNRVALSNMPVKKEYTKEGDFEWKVLEFERTPAMSTYLIAFVVGEFDYAECIDEDGTIIRVHTPVQKADQGAFATQVAMKTLHFYRKYFGVPYPLKKLDLVAAPDFPIGAMENWGLVIFKEGALLIDQNRSSSLKKNYVAIIVAHELAHKWFGNLVTIEWWTHLWLKEGFATWISYLAVDHCLTEFDVWTQFISKELSSALELDALDSSHPIEVDVVNPGEIDEIFDAISYSKGASVIRMLHGFLGDEDFRKGLTIYLNRYEYKSARTEDLWECLEEASGKQVSKVMSCWTKQKGFPVLKVSEEQTGESRIITITQQKFSVSLNSIEDLETVWIIPVTITSELNPEEVLKQELVDSVSCNITLEIPEGYWIKVNAGTRGVYRVLYSSEMLNRLIQGIEDKTLPVTDRLGIISDLFALNWAGLLSSTDLLNTVKAFTHETNYTVWSELLSSLLDLAFLLDTDTSIHLNNFICHLLSEVYAELGWKVEKQDDEGELILMLRELVTTTLGICGDQSVINRARAAFDSLSADRPDISTTLARPVFKTVIKHGTRKDFVKLKTLYSNTDSAELKEIIRSSFGLSSDPHIIQEALEFAISDSVRAQDTTSIIAQISRWSERGRRKAWEFFQGNRSLLYKRYESSTILARLVNVVTCYFATDDMAEQVEDFFSRYPSSAVTRTVSQSCERIRLRASWLERNALHINEYLKQNLCK